MERQSPDVSEPLAPDKTDDDNQATSTSVVSSTPGIPSIHISPTHVEVVGGQSHTISCSVSSSSVITDVTWIKTTADGDEIVNVVGVDGKFSGGTLSDPSLTINNIAKSDEGTYVCRATHCLGTISSEYSVLTCKDNPFPVHTINQGRTNYARLGLVVVDIFPNILRKIMCSNIHPEVLYRLIKAQLKTDPSVFNRMTHEERVSLNSMTSSTYDNIDFITLYKLMRTFLILAKPTQGWGKPPMNADVTISDDVERLRFTRNKIVHRINADIDLIEMGNYFSDILYITERIDTYLGKIPDQGFTREVLNFQTDCMDAETEQKYHQALKDSEDIKEKFSKGNMHFYYGKTFSNLIQDVKKTAKSSVISISIVLEDINDGEKRRMMNELKTEINSGLVNIKFKQAVSGSLIIYIDILDSNLLSTEHELGHQIYKFLCRALQLTRFNMKTENEITVVLIKEEDDIEVEFSIESDNWETYDEEISLRSNSLCLELDVNTEIFNTEQKMQSEFCLLVKSVLGSNGKSNIESVSARLEPGIVEQNPCSRKLVEIVRELEEIFRRLHYTLYCELDHNSGRLHYRELGECYRLYCELDHNSGQMWKIVRRLRDLLDKKLGYNTGELEEIFREMEKVFRELEEIFRLPDKWGGHKIGLETFFRRLRDRLPDKWGDHKRELEEIFRELEEIFRELEEIFRRLRDLLHHELSDNTGELEEIFRRLRDRVSSAGRLRDRRLRDRVTSAELKLHTKGRDVTLKDIGKTESEKPVVFWHTEPPASSPPNPPN